MQTETPAANTAIDLMTTAKTFLEEMTGKAERSKKSLPAVPGMQLFLLYVKAGGHIPKHQVAGPITVQTLLGHARMESDGRNYDLPAGAMAPFAPDAPHDVSAIEESVLLVTRALE